MLFVVNDHTEWYEGIVATYNIWVESMEFSFHQILYCNETMLNDEDLEFID